MGKAAKKPAPKKAEARGRGRPVSYRPEFAGQAATYCQAGATDFELGRLFEVDTATIYRWKNTYPEFCEAVQGGKENADERVVRSFFNRAVGYSFESEKVFQHQGEIIRATTVEHVPPDSGAALNWLKNRRPKEWRERKEVEHHVTLSLADLVTASYRDDLPALPDPKVIEHGEGGQS